MSLYHTHEHFYHSIPKINSSFQDYKKYYKFILERFPKFSIVRDVANCTKHDKLTQGNPSISDLKQLEAFVLITEYEDEQGTYFSASKRVVANLNSGEIIDLAKLLKVTDYFWRSELFALGLWQEKPVRFANNEPKEIPSRDSISGGARLDLNFTQGRDVNMKFKVVKHKSGS